MVREALTLERLRAMDPAEAAAHFVARRADGLTEQEEALLVEWLGIDEAHGRAFDRANRAWGLFDDAADNELLDAMRTHALERRPRRRPVWQQLAAIAAVLLLILGAGWLLMPMTGRPPASDESAIRYVAARGPVKEIALPDGSRMALDADSTAIARFGPARRSIELARGRAYFAVSPDRTRPFTVDAMGQRITAVGTEFDVALAEQALTVTLIEGRVTVGPPGDTAALVTLQPGQQLIDRDGKVTVRTLGSDTGDSVGWRQGLMDFDDETLADAVAQVNRYSQRQIVVRDPQVAAMRVSGQFRSGDAERFAATIAELHPVQVVQRGEAIELVRAK